MSNIENLIKLGSPSSQDTGSNIIKFSHEGDFLKKEIDYGGLLKKFKDKLDSEIKKIYFFFSQKERELYVLINSRLHIRDSYGNFSFSQLIKEIFEIKKISQIALNLSKFIHLNMTSIKKILKKFDKNFYHIYGKVTMLYIYKKLELKHSDLLYILNLKIIDETSAIIENIMKDLKFFANKKGLKKIKSLVIKPSEKILNNEDFEKQHSQDQLIPNENDLDKSHNDIPNIFKDVELNIFRIDELYLSFRKSFKEWTYHLKNTNKTYNNGYSIVANTSVLGIPSSDKPYKSESSDDLYQKYIRSPATSDIISLKAHSIDSEFLFTSENMNNVILILAHSFLFMFSYSIVIPTNCVFLSDIGIEKFYSGLALGLTPLGTILSLFIAKYAANWSFKKPLILSIFLSFLSAGLYIFASILKSFTLIMVSRFILGVGSFRYLNRAYLKHFIGQKKISKYLLFYQLSSLIGLAAGPLFSIPLSLIGNTAAFQDDRLKNIFNFSTFPAWLLLLLNLLLILMFIVYFSEPLDTAFMAFRDGITFDVRSVSIDRDRLSYKDKNMIDDIDKKLSQINENNKFSDTNLVNKFLQEIAWKESNSNSYLYKCFSVFIILLIIVRVKIFIIKKKFILILFLFNMNIDNNRNLIGTHSTIFS